METTEHVAANADKFWPPELQDSEFVAWAHRTVLKISNLPEGTPEHQLHRAFFGSGVPSQAWAQAFVFLLELSKRPGLPGRSQP